MAVGGNSKHRRIREPRLYTLTEVARSISVSMPTAQRYKKIHQQRIPAVGKGRKQRYPKEALEVFAQIKNESMSKRGRPRKVGKATATSRVSSEGLQLLTLTEISRRAGISYPTCISYVKKYLDSIPHVGTGRGRRYPPEAVEVFRELRKINHRGRRESSSSRPSDSDKALLASIRELERSQRELVKRLEAVIKLLNAPLQVTIKRR